MASSFGRIRLSSQLPGTLGSRRDLHQGGPAVSTTAIPDRFTMLPDEHALQAAVTALEEHGFSVEVAGDLDAARQAVLARIPDGSPVMTSTSVTWAETGIADAINDDGSRWESSRPITRSSTKRPQHWTEPDSSCQRISPAQNTSPHNERQNARCPH